MELAVALVAEEGAGLAALRLLADRQHRVVAVFTGASDTRLASVADKARSIHAPLRDARAVRAPATAAWLREQRADLLLNVHSLHVINPTVLEAPSLGAYNLHPGPLPEWAGLHTPSWAVYSGVDHYGVTLHRMTSQVDAGPIVFADEFGIGVADTGLAVMMQCVRKGVSLIERLLDIAERRDVIPARPQDLARRRWFGAGPPDGGRLNWHLPAHRIRDFVRACDYRPFTSPWGFPRTTANGLDVAVVTARVAGGTAAAAPGTVAHADGGTVRVAAADAWVTVDRVRVDGETLPAAEVMQDGGRLR
jgi:UDP-4-amino-4-deoxy-L-arabinose formyltransferase/UDP-glucuronic acid dehydrogenase (UDP-4-keto-hexauronic acid decarboxylating)